MTGDENASGPRGDLSVQVSRKSALVSAGWMVGGCTAVGALASACGVLMVPLIVVEAMARAIRNIKEKEPDALEKAQALRDKMEQHTGADGTITIPEDEAEEFQECIEELQSLSDELEDQIDAILEMMETAND